MSLHDRNQPLKKSLTIEIKEPCHQDWAMMSPTQKGSFCNACNKEVFDFTYKTDHQILETLSKSQNTCGRFLSQQLNRPLASNDQSYFLQGGRRIFTTLLSLFTLYRVHAFEPDQSQAKLKALTYEKDSNPEPFILGDVLAQVYDTTTLNISGYVTDRQDQHPIKGATVKLIGSSLCAKTDALGFFKIDTMFISEHPKPSLPIKLLIKCQHYDAKYLTVDSPSGIIHTSLRQSNPIILNDVIISGIISPAPMQSKSIFPDFEEMFNYFFFQIDEIDATPVVNTGEDFQKKKPLPPPLSERLVAWIDDRRKTFSKWTSK